MAEGEECRSGATIGKSAGRLVPLITLMVVFAGGAGLAADYSAGGEPLPVRDAVGDGMHAYHAGDYHRAYDDLTRAIEAGAEDPRSYFFRGLAALRIGRTDEAEADFAAGADRELATGSTRRVSLSLERVQGPDRLTLERFRSRARLGALQREREEFERRYSAIEDSASDVRRRRRPADIRPELVAPGVPATGLPAPAIEEVPPPAAKPAAPGKTAPAKKPTKNFEEETEDETEGDDQVADAETAEDEQAERDDQEEEMDAEVEDTAAERDVQAEADAASGR